MLHNARLSATSALTLAKGLSVGFTNAADFQDTNVIKDAKCSLPQQQLWKPQHFLCKPCFKLEHKLKSILTTAYCYRSLVLAMPAYPSQCCQQDSLGQARPSTRFSCRILTRRQGGRVSFALSSCIYTVNTISLINRKPTILRTLVLTLECICKLVFIHALEQL